MKCIPIFSCGFVLILYMLTAQASAQGELDNVSYARLQQKSVHNAYQRKETVLEMLRSHAIRSLELDMHIHKPFNSSRDGDWFVYHKTLDLASKVGRLSDGLAMLRQFHEENPQHEVITLWMDLKDAFDNGSHRPEDLDNLLESYLGEALWSPQDLQKACPSADTLQEAVSGSCRWPTFQDLKGRFLVVLTEAANMVYIDHGQSSFQRRAFIAPTINEVREIEAGTLAIFFNVAFDKVKSTDLISRIKEKGLVSRSWDLNSIKDWQEAVKRGVNHLGTNKVNQAKDTWSTTLQADGSLFAVIAL